jgi:hypothetical protein
VVTAPAIVKWKITKLVVNARDHTLLNIARKLKLIIKLEGQKKSAGNASEKKTDANKLRRLRPLRLPLKTDSIAEMAMIQAALTGTTLDLAQPTLQPNVIMMKESSREQIPQETH